MDISTYRPLISKVLTKCSGKGLTSDQVAAAICERISSFEEDMALMGGTATIIKAPMYEVITSADAGPKQAIGQQIDISSRIGSEPDGALMECWTKEQLLDFAKNEMPSVLQVKPPEYDQPFEINKFVESAPGDLGFVNIIYQPSGGQIIDNQRMGPTARISTTDRTLDADELTEGIIKQANALYTKTKRVLTPRMPALGNSPGDLRGALSAEAPGTGEEGLTMPMDNQMSQQWKAQRR